MSTSVTKTITVFGEEIPYHERDIPLTDLVISNEIPSFKSEASSETGVVEEMRLEGKFEAFGTGPIVVWERLDGQMVVFSGRHRDDLANRTEGVDTIFAHVVEEEDGFTQDMALFLDAELNIREGQGTIRDMAHFLKYSDMSDEDLKEKGWLSRSAMVDAWHLGRRSIDDLYGLYRDGKIREGQAIEIVKAAPDDPIFQRIGIKYVFSKKPSTERLRQYMSVSLPILVKVPEYQQGDLFGQDDQVLIEADMLVDAATKVRQEMNDKILVAKAVLRRLDQAREMGITVDDIRVVDTKINQAKRDLEEWKTWETDHDKVHYLRELIGLTTDGFSRPDYPEREGVKSFQPVCEKDIRIPKLTLPPLRLKEYS